MQTSTRALFLLFMTTICFSFAGSEETPLNAGQDIPYRRGALHILSIGQTYEKAPKDKVEPLPANHDAARVVMQAFIDARLGGADAGNQILLLDDQAFLTQNEIENAITEIGEKAGNEDIFVLFFAGHGRLTSAGKGSVLLGEDQLIESSILARQMSATPARHKILILDACHSGSLGASLSRDGITKRMNIEAISQNFPDDVVILSTSMGNQVSYTIAEIGASSLAYFIQQALSDNAAEADENLNGVVDMGELYTYVSKKTNAYFSKFNKDTLRESITAPVPQISQGDINIGAIGGAWWIDIAAVPGYSNAESVEILLEKAYDLLQNSNANAVENYIVKKKALLFCKKLPARNQLVKNNTPRQTSCWETAI